MFLEKHSLDTRDEAVLTAVLDKTRIVSAVRMLFLIAAADQGRKELVKRRLEHTTADLGELASKVDDLTLIRTIR